ncbi:hypothetical protein QYF36_010408 [Acer negundo]|nr:hypothetical protein QYF36_010408 [Acer negundo]
MDMKFQAQPQHESLTLANPNANPDPSRQSTAEAPPKQVVVALDSVRIGDLGFRYFGSRQTRPSRQLEETGVLNEPLRLQKQKFHCIQLVLLIQMQLLSFLQMREAATCMQEAFQFIMYLDTPRKCGWLLAMDRRLALLLPPVNCTCRQFSPFVASSAHPISSTKGQSLDAPGAYHVGCFPEDG